MVDRRTALVITLGLVGCGARSGGELPDGEVLDGTDADALSAPALDSCYVGLMFADCGGRGPPVFACDMDDVCRWFPGGVVADGYESSGCLGRDLCCDDGWPFPAGRHGGEIFTQVYSWGVTPWDRERAVTLAVTAGDSLPPPTGRVDCDSESATIAFAGPCGSNPPVSGLIFDTVTILVGHGWYSSGLRDGWQLGIELLQQETTISARACKLRVTDVIGRTCVPIREPDCAISGTVAIQVLPENDSELTSLRIDASLVFAGGGWMDLSL